MSLELSTVPPDKPSAIITSAKVGEGARADWMLCQVGKQLHAIPIDCVIEIMRVLPIEPIAGAPPYISGVCIIRGEPLPVVDAGLLIGQQASAFGRLLTMKIGERTVALRVDAILGIRTLEAGIFDELPPMLSNIETVAAIGTVDAALLLALRAARLVPESVFVSIESKRERQ